MNHSHIQYRMPYKDDDTDDSISPKNPNSDFDGSTLLTINPERSRRIEEMEDEKEEGGLQDK